MDRDAGVRLVHKHGWLIVDDTTNAILAWTIGPVAHPNTAPDDSWVCARSFRRIIPLTFRWTDTTSSARAPLSLEHIGHDYFMGATPLHGGVWYTDPVTKEVHHSGAKARQTDRSRQAPGKRFCSICKASFSANNFVTQHLGRLHPRCLTSADVARAIRKYA